MAVAPTSPWWGEHRCRYRLAQGYVRGARVLDVACGTGFGVAMLADAGAAHVAGVDLDESTLAEACREHGGERRSFLRADGTRLPVGSMCFDLVISFETLEHVPASEAFIGELRRVLAPRGRLILSTPNRQYTEMNGCECTNPFHVREYAPGELRELLLSQFSSAELLGQRLSPEYRLSPFASDHQRMDLSMGMRLRLLWWKLQNKLPFAVKDRLSHLFAGHPFYPGEGHYEFTAQQIETAPVLVAICRP